MRYCISQSTSFHVANIVFVAFSKTKQQLFPERGISRNRAFQEFGIKLSRQLIRLMQRIAVYHLHVFLALAFESLFLLACWNSFAAVAALAEQ